MYLLNTCLLIAKRLKHSIKFELTVPIKHGTSIIYN